MDVAVEVVPARVERRDRVRRLRRPGDDLPLEERLVGGQRRLAGIDRDVVRDAGVLVLERQLRLLARCQIDLVGVEREPRGGHLRGDADVSATATSTGTGPGAAGDHLERSVHRRVDVAVDVVVARLERTDRVVGGVRPGDQVAAEPRVGELRFAGEHGDVVLGPAVLVVEVNRHLLVGGYLDAVRVERDAGRGDGQLAVPRGGALGRAGRLRGGRGGSAGRRRTLDRELEALDVAV